MIARLEITAKAKPEVFQQVGDFITEKGFKITKLDILRPWGFFFYIDEAQTDKFIKEFYGEAKLEGIDTSLPLQPKILAVEPGKRLSWQYHFRRSEIWRIISGPVGIAQSQSDHQASVKSLEAGEIVSFSQGTRHRGAGLKQWGVIAEIWQHTDKSNPSNEEDIVRLQDDFKRK